MKNIKVQLTSDQNNNIRELQNYLQNGILQRYEKKFEVILEEKKQNFKKQEPRFFNKEEVENVNKYPILILRLNEINKFKQNTNIDRNLLKQFIIHNKTTKYLLLIHHSTATMNQTNLFFYYTPTKIESKEVTVSGPMSTFPLSTKTLADQKLDQKLEKLREESINYDDESQMTQKILYNNEKPIIPFDNSFSKVLFTDQETTNQSTQFATEASIEKSPFNTKINKQVEEDEEDLHNAKTLKLIKGISKNKLKKVNSDCSIKIRKFDSVKSLQMDEMKRSSTFSEKVTKLITQIKNNKDETKRTLSPSRNTKLNAILNRGSLKDLYRHLLGSKVIEIKNAENQELLNLMMRVDEIMIRRNQQFLSELISSVSGLTIQKMNIIMNIFPTLYHLSLKPNKFQQQDMLIVLPNSENNINIQEWRQQRFADFKQRLYYSEKQQQNNDQQPAYLQQKLTNTILQGLNEKQNQLNEEFNQLLSQQSNQQQQQQMITSPPLQTVAQIVKKYFEIRNVSNMFKINIVEQIAKNSNATLVIADCKLNELIQLYPSWLTEVKSSVLGVIIRINYSFNVESILN